MSKQQSQEKKDKRRTLRQNLAPFVGLGVMGMILLLFNAQLITANILMWVAPPVPVLAIEEHEPTTEAPRENQNIPKDPLIVMPTAGIKAPVVYGMNSIAEDDIQRALQDGVLHFGGTPLPGEAGNSVFVGHSSGAPWAPGDYKFVFMTLNQLEAGDKVQLAYEGELYIYEVMGKKVVNPTDVSVLEQTPEATATFITCWPIGTNAQRVVIKTKLVSHEPRERSSLQGAPELNRGLPGNSYNPARALQEQFR
jgi:LPXTG-site transpeptidase (sortase) family protein